MSAVKLHFYRFGTGDPLIILHGLFGTADNWIKISRDLANKYMVIVPDLRNHGRSPHSSEFTYQSMVSDILELVKQENIESFHLLGHSMGGKTAMMLALNNPQLVKKLVIADIAPRLYIDHNEHSKYIEAMLLVDPSNYKTRGEIDIALRQYIPNDSIRLFLLKNLHRDQNQRLEWRINLSALSKSLPGIMEAITADYPFSNPTLFLAGEQSNYISSLDQDDIFELFPNATIQTIPEAGHWLHADQPELFLQRVQEFLTR